MLRVTDMLPYFQVKRQKIGDARLRSSVTVSPELGQIMSGLHNSEDILIASFFKMDGRRGRPKTERNWYCQLTKSEEYLDWDEMYHLKAEELSSKITTMDWHCCVTCETQGSPQQWQRPLLAMLVCGSQMVWECGVYVWTKWTWSIQHVGIST